MDQRRSTGTGNSLEDALKECQRWIEAVTGKHFAHSDFRQSLSDGILLCELINVISPRSVRRINRLPTTYAFLDNLKSFLQACKGLGLEGSQLFDTTDLQGKGRQPGPATEGGRKLRNVAITLYWLGKKASTSGSYRGAHLNDDAFQNLIGSKRSVQLYGPDGGGGETETKRSVPNFDVDPDEEEREWALEEARKLREAAERNRRSQELMLQDENNLEPHEKVIRISKARRGESGFGFAIAGGENGEPVFVDSIKPGSSSALSNLQTGDEITFVNGVNVEGASKQKVLTLIGRGDVIGNISLRVKRSIAAVSSPDLVERGWDVRVITKEVEEDDETIVAEENYDEDDDDDEPPPVPPPPEPTLEEKVEQEQARIERLGERRRQRQQEGENSSKRWSANSGGGAPSDVPVVDPIKRRSWLEQDKQALDMVRSVSVPRKPKHPFTLQDAQKRARSVEKEKEELEALKAKRRQRERDRAAASMTTTTTNNIDDRIRRISPPVPPRSVRAKASPEDTAIIEGILRAQQRERAAKSSNVELLKVDAEKKRFSQTMQEETRAEFEKLKSERQEITDLEEEADRMLREAEMELALFTQSFGAEMNDDEITTKKKKSPTPKKKPPPPPRKSPSPLLTKKSDEPFVRDAVVLSTTSTSVEPGSRLSLSVWGASGSGAVTAGAVAAAEEEEEDNEDLMELENELEKLHEIEMTWAKEQREERKKKEVGGEFSGTTVTMTTETMIETAPAEIVIVPPVEAEINIIDGKSNSDIVVASSSTASSEVSQHHESALKSEIEQQRLELEREKRSLELARQRQQAEAERLAEEMRQLEAKRREMETKRREIDDEEERSRRRRREEEDERRRVAAAAEMEQERLEAEEERRRLEEEERRRLAEIERQQRLADEETKRRRLAAAAKEKEAEDRRRIAEIERQQRLADEETKRRRMEAEEEEERMIEARRQEQRRQEQLEKELHDLELMDQRRRRLEEEEEEDQRGSYHEDMAFIKQVASGVAAEAKKIHHQSEEESAAADEEAIREEKVRRMREEIAHVVQENEDRRRRTSTPPPPVPPPPADATNSNRRSHLFVAHTEFDDSSGLFTTEM